MTTQSSSRLLSALTSPAVLLAACGAATPADATSDEELPTNAPPGIDPFADQRTTRNEPVDVRVVIGHGRTATTP